MELASLHTLARTEEGCPLWLTYKLLRSRKDRYGILCYVEGVDYTHSPHSIAAVEDLCACREEAEALMGRLARHQVAPAHLVDLIWEI
jgi:hypothetical protein